MKKLAILILTFAVSASIFAQEIENTYANNKRMVGNEQETIFGGDFSVRGFLELTSEVTTVRNQTVAMLGGGVDVVFNHKFNLGFVGSGMIAEVKSPNLSADDLHHNYLHFGYGGVKFEPVFLSSKKLHFTVPIIVGGGAIAETDFNLWDELDYDEHGYHNGSYKLHRTDAVFVFQPGLNAELNLFKHARLAIGAKYRFINDVDIVNLENKDFEGFSGNISLRLGWF